MPRIGYDPEEEAAFYDEPSDESCTLHLLDQDGRCTGCGLPVSELHDRGASYSGYDPA